MLNDRKRLVAALTGLGLAAALGFTSSVPAQAEPDIDDVSAQVDRLYREAEAASERYNDAKLELDGLTQDLDSLKSDEKRQGKQLDTVREQVRDSMLRAYQGDGLTALSQVVVSDDPTQFLSQLSTMSSYDSAQDHLYADYSSELKALGIRSDATTRRTTQVSKVEQRLRTEKETIDEKLADAKELLATLKEKERRELLSRSADRERTADPASVPSSVPASGRAAAAVRYAMAQVGKAYVYGAAGPSAYDCSGLTMRAWGAAGVGLPHSSSAQYGSGPHVAESDLRPGDLVFYYSPISHVGMYIGNGMIVNALNPGAGVRVSALHSMPYVGAVRPG